MSFTPMRRSDRQLDEQQAMQLLAAGEYGVLATVGEEGTPHGVPLNYVLADGAVWFHCALQGKKLENMRRHPKVCFTVVGKTQPVYAKNFTTLFESAILYGTASEVVPEQDKIKILRLLCEKYLPEHMEEFPGAMRSLPVTGIWKISIDHLTGKAKR